MGDKVSAVGSAKVPKGLDLDLNLSTKVYDDDDDYCRPKKKALKPVVYSSSSSATNPVVPSKLLSLSRISSSSSSSTQRNTIEDRRRSMNDYVLLKKQGISQHQLVIKSSPVSPQLFGTIISKEQQHQTPSTRLGFAAHNMVIPEQLKAPTTPVLKPLDNNNVTCDVEEATSPNKPPSCLQSSARNSNKKRAASSVDEEGARSGGSERKKLRLTEEQSAVLEQVFMKHCTVDNKKKLALAEQLNLKPRQVEVWFQNRRARTKLKQTEAHYEYLKGYCEELMIENQNLNKEIQRLRRSVAKFLPTPPEQQLCLQSNPVAGFTFVCPSCDRHLVPSSASDLPTSSSALTSTHASPSRTPSLTVV